MVEAGAGVILWFCCEKKTEGKSKMKGEREKKNHLHINNNCAYIHGYCSTFVYMHNFASIYVCVFLVKIC